MNRRLWASPRAWPTDRARPSAGLGSQTREVHRLSQTRHTSPAASKLELGPLAAPTAGRWARAARIQPHSPR